MAGAEGDGFSLYVRMLPQEGAGLVVSYHRDGLQEYGQAWVGDHLSISPIPSSTFDVDPLRSRVTVTFPVSGEALSGPYDADGATYWTYAHSWDFYVPPEPVPGYIFVSDSAVGGYISV